MSSIDENCGWSKLLMNAKTAQVDPELEYFMATLAYRKPTYDGKPKNDKVILHVHMPISEIEYAELVENHPQHVTIVDKRIITPQYAEAFRFKRMMTTHNWAWRRTANSSSTAWWDEEREARIAAFIETSSWNDEKKESARKLFKRYQTRLT